MAFRSKPCDPRCKTPAVAGFSFPGLGCPSWPGSVVRISTVNWLLGAFFLSVRTAILTPGTCLSVCRVHISPYKEL